MCLAPRSSFQVTGQQGADLSDRLLVARARR